MTNNNGGSNPLSGLEDLIGKSTVKKQSKSTLALNVLATLSKTRKTEVRLPILQINAIVSPFSGAEDLYLQTLQVQGATFHKYFDEIIYEHTEFIGIKFESFEDFLEHLSPIDKQVLVTGLLQATFTELPEKIIKCPKCGEADNYKFNPREMVHEDTYLKEWDKDQAPEDYTISNEIIPGLIVHYCMPTEAQKLKVLNFSSSSQMRTNLEKHNEVFSLIDLMSIYIKRIVIVGGSEDGSDLVLDDINDILPTIKEMPIDIQTMLIADQTVDTFTEFNPFYYFNIKCGVPTCGHEFKWDNIKPEQDFFRKALSLYNDY